MENEPTPAESIEILRDDVRINGESFPYIVAPEFEIENLTPEDDETPLYVVTLKVYAQSAAIGDNLRDITQLTLRNVLRPVEVRRAETSDL